MPSDDRDNRDHGDSRDWTAGGGDTGAWVRSLDGSRTALGPLQTWPPSLRATVSTCLGSRLPLLIGWGPELVMIYNDAFARLMGNEHPRALGQPGVECGSEVWQVLCPLLTSVFFEGASTGSENQRLDIERTLRSGCLEEAYFTFSCRPIRDESGGIGGVFCAVTETTAQVLSERRLRTLSLLAQHTAEVTTATDACVRAALALEVDALDIPTAFVYRMQGTGQLHLAAMTGVACPAEALPESQGSEWPLRSVLETGVPVVVDEVGVQRALTSMGCRTVRPVVSALLLPLGPVGKPGPAGILVVGLAPRLLLDDRYRSFLLLVASHIGAAVASARALEAAEQRADALAELDRAGLAFVQDPSFVMDAARWLPAALATPASRPARDVAEMPGTPGTPEISPGRHPSDARMLLVDDNADMRDDVGRLLRQHWQVDTASDGVEAWAMVRRAVPSLVLIDIMMPNLDGFGLLRSLRADPRTRTVPVVLLSTRAGEAARVEGLALGADDCLVKPFSAHELVARVTLHLELGQLRQGGEAARSRLHSLFAQAPAAIAVLRGPTFIFEFANAHYEEMMQRRELVGRPLFDVFPEIGSQAIHDILHGVFTTGERFVGRDFLVRLERAAVGQPEDIYFDFVYDPFRLADGSIEGIMVVAFEVTQRVHSAREQERLVAEREFIYAERADLLQREREARTVAERALRVKDEFVAMLGHELRNPLTPIVTALLLLRQRGTDDAEAPEYAIIDRQLRHLTALVNDLLDVSAITHGKIELKRKRIEFAVLLDHAIEMASPLVTQRRHELTVSVARHGLMVDVDATRVTQVITNLLMNAAKYTEPEGRIGISAQTRHGSVELCIVDNGIGIAPETLPHVFELFVQERQPIDRARGGLGLGLGIVQVLMTMHGGSVTAFSAGRGHGSTFTIRLPWVSDPGYSPPTVRALPVSGQVGGNFKILIVDDNADAADTLARLLTRLGFDVRVAYDGLSALVQVESFAPRVALLDIGLPGMDGYELASRLRRQPGTANTHLVAVTGYGQRGDIESAFKAGFDEHLVKPVDFEKLEGVLRRRSAVEP